MFISSKVSRTAKISGGPRATLRRRGVITAAALFTVAALVAGCTQASDSDEQGSETTGTQTTGTESQDPTTEPDESEADPPESPESAVTVLTSDVDRRSDTAAPDDTRQVLADFGIDVLHEVMDDDANTVISPYSLYAVLAMVRAGAEGNTADQLDAALHATGAQEQGAVATALDRALAEAVEQSARDPENDPITLNSANQMWAQHDFQIREGYLDELARQYGVDLVAAAFSEAPDEVRDEINAWVADRTNDLITDLFSEDAITDATRLVLVNALYLHANWAKPFDPTDPGAFTTADGSDVDAPMMSASGMFSSRDGDGWSSVTIPYQGGGLAMTILLPDTGEYDAVLQLLDADLLSAASTVPGARTSTADQSDPVTELTMPLFEVRSKPDVLTAMQNLGVADLFDVNSADLSGITGAKDLFVAQFVHEAVISVDENGTEAAAATGAAMEATSAPAENREMMIDRPFIYWIADTETGAPLFLGTVTDPTA